GPKVLTNADICQVAGDIVHHHAECPEVSNIMIFQFGAQS
ncbi:unnamed protein product, partial [marine sediment metagenome]